jgi:hypothetical protein
MVFSFNSLAGLCGSDTFAVSGQGLLRWLLHRRFLPDLAGVALPVLLGVTPVFLSRLSKH